MNCPWSGKLNCGCVEWPFTRDGIVPPCCEDAMSLAIAEVNLSRVSPTTAAKVKAWVAAGRKNER